MRTGPTREPGCRPARECPGAACWRVLLSTTTRRACHVAGAAALLLPASPALAAPLSAVPTAPEIVAIAPFDATAVPLGMPALEQPATAVPVLDLMALTGGHPVTEGGPKYPGRPRDATPPPAYPPPAAGYGTARSARPGPVPSATATERATATAPRANRAAGRAPKAETGAPASGPVEVAVVYALAQVGKQYVWGAAGPNTFDCSGLVVAAYARIGVRLPHQTGEMIARGRAVGRSELRRGDIVFPEHGHVAIYLGSGLIVHAANERTDVKVSPLYDFWAARRVVG